MRHGLVRPASHKTRVTGLSDLDGNAHLSRGGLGRAAAFRAPPCLRDGEPVLPEASVGVWREGLIERVTSYRDIDEARAAAERLAESRG